MRFTPTLRFFRRDAVVRGQPDPADMGTAFGMEASLESQPSDYLPSRSYPLESTASQVSQESPLAWLNRRSA